MRQERGGEQRRTGHRREALVLWSSLEVVALPPLEPLCDVDHVLRLLAEVVQRLHAALGDHCGGARGRKVSGPGEAGRRGGERGRTGLDGALEDVVKARHELKLLLDARLDKGSVHCLVTRRGQPLQVQEGRRGNEGGRTEQLVRFAVDAFSLVSPSNIDKEAT